MSSRRYKKVINRHQGTLLPPSLEDYVGPDNPVRAIDAYVESLELDAYGFQHASGSWTAGQPPYPPGALLKLYLYGYLNRVRSSRRLEKETHRNMEVIWLVEGLQPSYKTISDFRKDNPKALQQVNKAFVLLCKELELYGGELAGIDGSFLRASASKESIYSKEKLQQQLEKIEADIEHYLQVMQQTDQREEAQGIGSLVADEQLAEKLEALQKRQQRSKTVLEQMEARGEKQYGTTDADARLLKKRGQKLAGYNVQCSVDDKHKLIVTHEVTNDGNDLQQLEPMAKRTREIMESEHLTVAADAGYYNPEQIKGCVEVGITPYVAIPDKSKAVAAQGRFTREQFQFDAVQNHYRCPADQLLTQVGQPYRKRGRRMIRYASKGAVCSACEKRKQCLTEKSRLRQLVRWEHEQIIDAHRARMAADGQTMMCKRSGLCEHPFGTLKRWLGWDHFLVRGFRKVKGEMSLMVLCYNLKRVLNLIGIKGFRAYCAFKRQVVQSEGKPAMAG